MAHEQNPLKATANRLGKLFATDVGADILRQLKRAVRQEAPATEMDSARKDSSNNGAVGLWQPRVRDGRTYFVRTRNAEEPSSFWARTIEIPPKSNRKRIAFLGESVARGFFLDPHFNPASALEGMFRHVAGRDSFEVIDLARTDQLLEPLLDLAAATVYLKPDALVVLAGNNWTPMWQRNPAHRRQIATIIAQNGSWCDVKRYFERVLEEQVYNGVTKLSCIAQEMRIPLVLLVPEFNLADWRTDATGPPLLNGLATGEWHRVREEAERASDAGNVVLLEQLALTLLELDGGSTPVGPNLIASIALKLGDFAKARKYLEQARDTGICSPRHESPRCYSIVQEAIRRVAAERDCLLVDLPMTFQEHWRAGLPDRRMFFDYCHFTVEAIYVAMAAVANTLLTRFSYQEMCVRDVKELPITLDANTIAEAHFLAAIHNANWGQSFDIVRHHCAKAVSTSPEVTKMMTLFLGFHVRRTPFALSKEFNELCERGSTAAISLLFNRAKPIHEGFLNWKLITAIAETVVDQRPDIHEWIGRRVCQEHGVDEGDVDLLAKAYSADSHITPMDHDSYDYYRACEPTCQFRFVCLKPKELLVRGTYRCRNAKDGDQLTMILNGHEVFSGPASAVWRTATFRIDATTVHSGLNDLSILWPRGNWDSTIWKRSVAEDFEDGRIASVTPSWGELHSLRISMSQTPLSSVSECQEILLRE